MLTVRIMVSSGQELPNMPGFPRELFSFPMHFLTFFFFPELSSAHLSDLPSEYSIPAKSSALCSVLWGDKKTGCHWVFKGATA